MGEITVVVPVWDEYVRYLADSLGSVLAQEPPPRVLVVDNCSDVTPVVPAGVEVIRASERLTVGGARSLGLARVQTDLVLLWDADDHMPPGTLAALAVRLRRDPRLVLVAARIAEGSGQAHHWPRPFTTRLARRPGLFALLNSASSLVPTIGALMRTDVVRDAGGYPDLDTGDDWVLGVALSFRGRCEVIPQLGRIYHQHGDSVWAGRQTRGHLLEHSAAVRRRVANDPAAPRAVRAALPIVALGQWLVIFVLRPLGRTRRARPRIR